MKLEVGKFYRTRDGRKVGPVREATAATQAYRFRSDDNLGEYASAWFSDGRFYADRDSGRDLIAEWPEGEGWIAWNGGKSPVDGAVDYVTRRGRVYLGGYARALRWRHDDQDDDILFYRPHVAEPAAQPSGPVRERVVKEIVSGRHGHLIIGHAPRSDYVSVGIGASVPMVEMTADEIEALCGQLLAVANALRSKDQ